MTKIEVFEIVEEYEPAFSKKQIENTAKSILETSKE